MVNYNVEIFKNSCTFLYNNIKYRIDMYELINYVQDNYAQDDYVCNYDGLCDYIEILANNQELWSIVLLCEDIDAQNVESEWFSIDIYNRIYTFNNMYEFNELYDVGDIVGELIDTNMLEDYCERVI